MQPPALKVCADLIVPELRSPPPDQVSQLPTTANMTTLPSTVSVGPSDLPPNTCALPRTGQLAGLLTAIRDKNTARGDFIFYSDRIIRLLVEEGESDYAWSAGSSLGLYD